MLKTGAMFREAFEKVELEEAALILEELNGLFDTQDFDPLETIVMTVNVPFYPGYKLADVADYAQNPVRRRYALYKPGGSLVLEFTNEPIYKLNTDLPIDLTEDNVHEYVAFFFTYVRGKHGRFLIVENVDDINWKEDPPPSARKAISKMIVPITLHEVDPKGVFHLQASMMFKDSLFKSQVDIDPKGFVTLKDEELLVEDMPVLDDVLNQ